MRKIFLFGCLSVVSFLSLAQKKPVKTLKKVPTKLTQKPIAENSSIQAPLKLWYDAPAKYFEESLVLGNGQQGATVFGGISTDKIYLNDLTLWSGEPVDPNMNPNAYKNLPAVREALAEKNYKKAQTLVKKLQGKFSESYAPLGTLLLEFNDDPYVSDYYRELDIDQAIAKVKTESNTNMIERAYLVSNPDKIFVVHLKSKKTGALGFTVRFESLLLHTTTASNNLLQANGVAPVKADPNYVQKKRNAILFDKKRGTRFAVNIQIKTNSGKISNTDTSLSLANATEATIYISMATSFNGYDKDPATQGLNQNTIAQTQLTKAVQLGWDEIKKRPIKDYQTYYNRVALKLEGDPSPNLPTNERLKRYAKGEADPYLETLYFQFGRYLLISSSRTPAVPANLQGIWNSYLQPPWSSNYT
ncbi:MAG: glycoside hydrolase family 95 protein, partial [Sediminibacterium sp.]